GQTVPIIDPTSGEVAFDAQIFVAVLGASNHTYAEAFRSQELEHWISGHIDAFESWGGVTRIVVPDNPRTGVTKAHRYEPILNATYAEMAAHYGVAVIPARPRRPRDKAYATDCTSFLRSEGRASWIASLVALLRLLYAARPQRWLHRFLPRRRAGRAGMGWPHHWQGRCKRAGRSKSRWPLSLYTCEGM